MVTPAMTAITISHPGPKSWFDGCDQGCSACRKTFRSTTKLAIFEPVAIQAVTGAGAPIGVGAH